MSEEGTYLSTFKHTPNLMSPYVGTLTYSALFLEIVCYGAIFEHLYKNDNVTLRTTLSRTTRSNRNRKNAISLSGQIYTFVAEIVGISSYLITKLSFLGDEIPISTEVTFVYIICQYEIFSVVEVLTSPELRRILHLD